MPGDLVTGAAALSSMLFVISRCRLLLKISFFDRYPLARIPVYYLLLFLWLIALALAAAWIASVVTWLSAIRKESLEADMATHHTGGFEAVAFRHDKATSIPSTEDSASSGAILTNREKRKMRRKRRRELYRELKEQMGGPWHS
jgi:hypothetical protein